MAGQTAPRVMVRLSPLLPALLLPVGAVSQMAVDPVLALVPNCQPWFRGVYGMRGTLVPVFDVAAERGLALAELRGATVLVIDPARKPMGLLCIQAPEIVTAFASEPRPLPAELSCLAGHIGRPMMTSLGPIFEFDFRSWLSNAAQNVVRTA